MDVVVVGGGPAGAATARALGRAGVSVTLIEASTFDGPRIGESIPPNTQPLLAELGLWASFLAEKHAPCHGSVSAWGSPTPGYNNFLFNPYGHGWHLDRRRFDPWLAAMAAEAGAHVLTGVAVTGVTQAEGFRLSLSDGRTLHARRLVDATGRGAKIARMLGAQRRLQDRLVFVYGFFPPGSTVHPTSLTLLEAVADGWWYAARLPDGQLVAAVASDPESLRDTHLHQPARWLAALRATTLIGPLLVPDATPDAELITCEAPSARLDPVVGPGWLAVGDAASSFDPLSSQGIHKALSDGIGAAAALRASLDDPTALDTYAAQITSRFEHYLQTRQHFYALERRWPEAPFWARRRSIWDKPVETERNKIRP